MSRNEHASARINKIQLALWRKRPLSFKFGGIPTTFFSPFLDCKTVRIFAYLLRSSSQKEGLERGWKQRARLGRDAKNTFLFLSPHGRVTARAFRASKTLTPIFFTDFFTDFEKKPTVLQSSPFWVALTFCNNQVFFLISAKLSTDSVQEEELAERSFYWLLKFKQKTTVSC